MVQVLRAQKGLLKTAQQIKIFKGGRKWYCTREMLNCYWGFSQSFWKLWSWDDIFRVFQLRQLWTTPSQPGYILDEADFSAEETSNHKQLTFLPPFFWRGGKEWVLSLILKRRSGQHTTVSTTDLWVHSHPYTYSCVTTGKFLNLLMPPIAYFRRVKKIVSFLKESSKNVNDHHNLYHHYY